MLTHAAATSSSTSNGSTPSLKEIAVDLRLMKHSVLEVQDSVRDLFSKMEGILQRLPTLAMNLSPMTDHDSNQQSSSGALQSSVPEHRLPPRYQIKYIVVNLPFSQRHCHTTNVPPSSTQSLVYLPFVTTLQNMQKKEHNSSVDLIELYQEIQRSDPIFMERTGAKRFRDYIVQAQQFVDININEVDMLDNKWYVYLKSIQKPWLRTSRGSVPSWEEQEQEITLYRKVPIAAAERYMPLLEALISDVKKKSLYTLAELWQHPSVQEYKVLKDMNEIQWSQYCHDATKLCNISIRGNGVREATIKLLNTKKPFYTARFNDHFFPLTNQVASTKSNLPKLSLPKRTRDESASSSNERNEAKKARKSTPFISSRSKSHH